MILTKEQQALLDGEQGETMAKIVKTLVMYGGKPSAPRKWFQSPMNTAIPSSVSASAS